MKQKMNILLSLAGLCLVSSLQANSDCCDRERMCSPNPLFCDGFNIQFHAGPSPIIWKNRGCMSFLTTSTTITPCLSSVSCPSTNCSTSNNCGNVTCVQPLSISSLTCSEACGTSIAAVGIPKFNRLFETPWSIGTTLGYAITNNHEVFAEFNYTQAANKPEYFTTTVTAGGVPVLLQTNLVAKYKNATAYFGYRYNFERGTCMHRSTSWFLDLKAGLIHHYGIRGFINSSLTSSILDGTATPFYNVFRSTTGFIGAGEVGVDICLSCNWSLLIAAEVAATWGPTCHSIARPVTELGNTNINTAKIGAEILFPVTFGLRYKF